MKIAVLGYGSIARRHLANIKIIRPDAQVMLFRASCLSLEDVDSWVLQARSFGEILDFAPDAAIIASPASEHIPQALAFARGGAHLLVEKPLSCNLDSVDDLINLCDVNKLVLMVGYNMAHMSSLSNFISSSRSGSIGEMLAVHAEVGQYLPNWRSHIDYKKSVSACAELGGGVLLELSHEIEYIDRLIGGTEKIFCLSRKTGLLDIDVEDVADVMLQNASGLVATIHMNMEQKVPYRSCCVTGTEGMLYMNITDNIVYSRGAGHEKWQKHTGDSPIERNRMYLDELTHFFECVETGNTPFPDGGRGRFIVKVVMAAKRSSTEGALIQL